ncbi:unnamed protein product, partial [Staurois parvus]
CAPAAPVSVHQCQLSVVIHCHLPVPISATFQCPSVPQSMPDISAHLSCLLSVTLQCQSVSPINASQCHLSVLPNQCHLSVPVSAAYQCASCCLSVLPISAINECCLLEPISDACQCPSVPPT